MNTAKITEACRASIEKNKPFPEVVAVLAASGVERYHADLVQRRKTYYGTDSSVFAQGLDIPDLGAAPPRAAMEKVRAIIKAIQQRQIGYIEFLRQIVAAGITDYHVYFAGRCAVYVDRRGESHTEWFPGAQA